MRVSRTIHASIIFALALLLAGCAVQRSSTSSDASSIEPSEAIAVIAAYEQARERRDPDALRLLLTRDVDQLTSAGQWRRGIDAALTGMRQSSQQNPGTRKLAVETVREIGPDAALVDARYTIAEPDGSERQLWSSFVVVRDAGSLRIAAIRNMRPAAP